MSNPIIMVLLNLLTNPIVIGGIVLLIVFIVKGARNKGADADAAPAEPVASATPASSSSSGGTSTIFINGGAPSSGNTMGKISVDGKSLSVLYTDAPVEITIPTGRHHVVVEGGVYGDARIDRFIDFGVLDVWTVDLPGGDDDDLIRHQMISYSEYRRALSDAGYRVTKKHL